MQRRILEGHGMNNISRPMATGMALSQSGLIEAVHPGNATFQINTMAFTTLGRIQTVDGTVAGQPVTRMTAAAGHGRSKVVGIAAADQADAGCTYTEQVKFHDT
jgi:hypothetical protein